MRLSSIIFLSFVALTIIATATIPFCLPKGRTTYHVPRENAVATLPDDAVVRVIDIPENCYGLRITTDSTITAPQIEDFDYGLPAYAFDSQSGTLSILSQGNPSYGVSLTLRLPASQTSALVIRGGEECHRLYIAELRMANLTMMPVSPGLFINDSDIDTLYLGPNARHSGDLQIMSSSINTIVSSQPMDEMEVSISRCSITTIRQI